MEAAPQGRWVPGGWGVIHSSCMEAEPDLQSLVVGGTREKVLVKTFFMIVDTF